MKKTIALSGFAVALLVLLSFSKPLATSSIKGKVVPAEYAVNAWAISKTDTLYTTVDKGHFQFTNVEPGVYKIIIGAQSPYKHTVKDNLVVQAGGITDLGELSLDKYVIEFK